MPETRIVSGMCNVQGTETESRTSLSQREGQKRLLTQDKIMELIASHPDGIMQAEVRREIPNAARNDNPASGNGVRYVGRTCAGNGSCMQQMKFKTDVFDLIEYWAMPNKNTFEIKPIAELLEFLCGNGLKWLEPIC